MFSEIFRTQTHTLRLVSPWECPGTYPIAQHTPHPSGGCPMARDCPTVPPAYPNFRQHTYGTQCTQHTDCKTTRLQISRPTESITKQPNGGKYREKPDRGRYREKPSGGKYGEKPGRGRYKEEAQWRQIQRKAYRGKLHRTIIKRKYIGQ